jgi:large subunit ribosomal protein L4e
MKLQILDTKGAQKGEKELPKQFDEELRRDIIKRAVLSLFSFARQPYGSDPRAGMKASATLSRKRRDYRGAYGFGISRVPRKIMSRRGTRMPWVAAVAPGTRKGRRAHAPKAEKKVEEHINKKERRKAIRSAIAATVNSELVKQRGHKPGDNYPFVLSSDFESLKKTKDVAQALSKLGLDAELKRCSVKKVRAGKGTMRNRKYSTRKGPLFVVANNCPLMKSGNNIQGVDIVNVRSLNASLLSPGTSPGRLTLWTENAIDTISKEKLYL